MSEKLKNDIKISLCQTVLELLIKTTFCTFWSITQEPQAWCKPYCNFNTNLEFVNLLQNVHVFIKTVLIILRQQTKHAQYWFGVQFHLPCSPPRVWNTTTYCISRFSKSCFKTSIELIKSEYTKSQQHAIKQNKTKQKSRGTILKGPETRK